MTPTDVHVAINGSPHAMGTVEDPFPTLASARDHVRAHRQAGQHVTIHIAPGRYELEEPLRLGPQDSDTSYVADGETGDVVIDGARLVTRWSSTQINGVHALVADAPTAAIKSMFAHGRRLSRTRLPQAGFFRLDASGFETVAPEIPDHMHGSDRFTFVEGDIPALSDPTGVEALVPHYWVAERMPLEAIDHDHQLFVSSRRSILTLRDDVADGKARYYLENVREALVEPGLWYHDRADGLLYYVPRDGEHPQEFEASVPLIDQFIVVAGDPQRGEAVSELTFERLVFRHADWLGVERVHEPFDIPQTMPDIAYASAPQAAANVAGAIEFSDARDCTLRDCVVEHVGGYGVELGSGVQRTTVERCTLRDLGAGGVKLNGAQTSDDPRANRDNVISDCEITSGGHVFPAGIGVLLRHSSRNDVVHNHIHDFEYSGISCGWIWGYAENVAKDNHLDFNHIHDIGHGLLSDMGGIYVLGVQPGTTVRGNHVHDIHCANYGGWAIYLDEGSSHVVVEGNLAYDAATQAFHQHYGRENIVRNNVFAFGGRAQVTISRPEEHVSVTFERNIVIGNGRPAFSGRKEAPPDQPLIISDLNLFWDVSGVTELAGVGRPDVVDPEAPMTPLGNEAWHRAGHDRHSIIIDPACADLAGRDFTLSPDSPAWALGFEPLSARTAGPRGAAPDS